jgi:hypothetical protein
MASNRASGGTAWTGWVIFASTMLIMLGAFNFIGGLVAIFDDERLAIVANRLVAVDVTGWGWTVLIFGALLVLVGFGLLTAQGWARITAIVLVGLHAVVQITWLSAYPVWSLLMIALDVVVLFALTAKWTSVRDTLDPYGSPVRSGQQTPVG